MKYKGKTYIFLKERDEYPMTHNSFRVRKYGTYIGEEFTYTSNKVTGLFGTGSSKEKIGPFKGLNFTTIDYGSRTFPLSLSKVRI